MMKKVVKTNEDVSTPSDVVEPSSEFAALGGQPQDTEATSVEGDAMSGHCGPRVVPVVQAEPSEPIFVAQGEKLVVPREDIGNELEAGEDLDLVGMQTKKIRRPHRREWIALNLASELPVRLLLHKPKADGVETEYYYVEPQLRGPIQDELKECRVFVYFSYTTKSYALLVVHVTPDNPWYESMQTLLRQPATFFANNAIRIQPEKLNSRYRIKHKPLSSSVAWPATTTGELLGDALGHEKMIKTPDHPLYRDLIDGIELT